MNTKALGSDGLVFVLTLLLVVSFLGITVGTIIRDFGTENNVAVNETILNNLDSNEEAGNTFNEMRNNFVDDEGNARTGISDVLNTLFTGIGGVITTLFQSPVVLANVFGQIATSMGIVSGEGTATLLGLGIQVIIVIVIIGAVYMVRRI